MADLKTIETLIAEKAEKQARKEWEEFEDVLLHWANEHPAGNCSITQIRSGHFGPGNDPLCRLTAARYTSSETEDLELKFREAMCKYCAAWVAARTEVLIEERSKEVLRQVSLLSEE